MCDVSSTMRRCENAPDRQPTAGAAVFGLIAQRSSAPAAEMHEVFNMGCGFCVVVPAEQADDAVRWPRSAIRAPR